MGRSFRYLVFISSGLSSMVLLFIMNYKDIGTHGILSDSINNKREKLKKLKLASQVSNELSKNDEINYSKLLLSDSVLSIVKNYYVDDYRTENSKIIKNIISYIAQKSMIRITKTPDEYLLEDGNYKLRLATPERISYDLLLHHILSLGNFLGMSDKYFDEPVKKGPKAGLIMTLKALLASLDAHSNLLSPESYQELRQGTEGTFGGLGVLVGMRDQLLTVIKPLPSSPAEKVGIHKMDRILSINGLDTYGYSLGDLVEYMRGAPGTKVHLSLLRDGAHSVRDIQVRREIIKVDSVTSRIIKSHQGNILYISIESFTSRTSGEMIQALKYTDLPNNGQRVLGVILDLRSNPGGLLDQAVNVADLFIDKGMIVSTKGRTTESEYAHPLKKSWGQIPIITLLNNESASASEIVAGALQDHDRSLIIGQPSFGKGSVQTIFELPDERALKLTIARYYTPSGQSIQNIGIIPDIWLQPVTSRKENINLLGPYRYKSERFLHNHLLSGQKHSKAERGTGKPVKGYYLSSFPSAEALHEDLTPDKDIELSLATGILRSLGDIHPLKIPGSVQRASHLMNLTSPYISAKLKQQNKAVYQFVKKSFDVDWTERTSFDTNKVRFTTHIKPLKEVHPGDQVRIPYQLTNTGTKTIPRISVFIRSPHVEVDTIETLAGSLKPGEVLKGHISLKIPAHINSGILDYETGLAFDASADLSQIQPIKFKVTSKKLPDLNIQVKLVDEVGGQVDGELEPRESARLKLYIQNRSGVAARLVKINLINLAGKQLILLDQKQQLKYLAPFQKMQVYFALKGADQVIDQKLGLGLFIESSDLPLPIRKKADIGSVPGQFRSGVKAVRQ